MKIIDLHCDTILKLMREKEAPHCLRENRLQVDIGKLRKANSLAQFFALYVYLKWPFDPLEICLEMADKFYSELEKNKDDIALARNFEEMKANESQGKISAFLTIEEGGVFKGKLHNLRNFYRLGVRLVTLVWNLPNEIGYPSWENEYNDKGLTPFGEEVVAEMNRLGMIIDSSHISDQGFYDVARLSTKPFVASHSNGRAVTENPRNLTDDMIKLLAEKGGVMGINYEKAFLGDSDISRVDDMVRHIKHIRNIGGIEVISLGSDFDGIGPGCEISDIGEIGKLINALRMDNFSEEDIEKICFRNALRIIKDIMI